MRNQEFLLPGENQVLWDMWWFSMYWLPSIVLASESGIIESLSRSPATAEKICQDQKLNPRVLSSILQLLTALNVLQKNDDETYHLSEQSRLYFTPGATFFWYGLSSDRLNKEQYELLKTSLHSPHDQSAYPTLIDSWAHGEYAEKSAEAFVHLFHQRSLPFAKFLAAQSLFQGVQQLLDVGGASGRYSLTFAKSNPGLKCSILELPAMCKISELIIKEENLSGQVTTLPLDMFRDQWPGNQDVVFLSNVLHDWNLEKSDGIVRKSFAALNDGGKILIHEMLFDEEVPATSVTAASLSLMMALHGQGRQYTKKEIENLLMKAGFENVSTVRALGPFSLTTGHRKKEI